MEWESDDNSTAQMLDVAAAALFAAAIAHSAAALADSAGAAATLAAIAFLVIYAALRQVPGSERAHSLPAFELAPIEPVAHAQFETGPQLLLTSEQAMDRCDDSDERLLDDAVSRVGALVGTALDARVVRLFDPGVAHGAGHGLSCPPGPACLDASRALSDALAELRRSLR